MIPTLSEVRATAKKAAKGVGLSWGLGDEAARATVWLHRRGLDGCGALLALLEAYDAGRMSQSDIQCPLHVGTMLLDGAADLDRIASRVQSPLLLLPFLADMSENTTVEIGLAWDQSTFAFRGGLGFSGGGTPPTHEAQNIAFGLNQAKQPITLQPRQEIAAETWAGLDRFAHRTYAPATEESRLAGAGAGLSDND